MMRDEKDTETSTTDLDCAADLIAEGLRSPRLTRWNKPDGAYSNFAASTCASTSTSTCSAAQPFDLMHSSMHAALFWIACAAGSACGE